MRRWFGLFFVLIFGTWVGLAGCCAQKSVIKYPAVSPAIKSTVMLYAPYNNVRRASIASGFAITDTKIMTAGHFCVNVFFGQVTGDIGPIGVVFVGNKYTHMGGTAEIIAVDENKDLCIINTGWKHGLKPLVFSDEAPEMFESVRVLGAPQAHFPVQTEGRVIDSSTSGYPVEMLNNRITFSNTVSFGNSGGPLINENDEVVGVVIAKEADFDHVGFAVKYTDIRAFLDEHYGEQFLER